MPPCQVQLLFNITQFQRNAFTTSPTGLLPDKGVEIARFINKDHLHVNPALFRQINQTSCCSTYQQLRQAQKQLETPGGVKSLLRGAQIF